MVPGAGPDTWPVLLSAGPGDTQWLEDAKQGRNKCHGLHLMGQVLTENIRTRRQTPQGDQKGTLCLKSPFGISHWYLMTVGKGAWMGSTNVPGAKGRLQGCSLLTRKPEALLASSLKIMNQF